MILNLDPRRRTVAYNDGSIRLGPTGFRIVQVLAGCPAGLEHESLYERTYIDRDDGGPGDDSFHAIISQLRRKLAAIGLGVGHCDRWGGLYRLTGGRP